MSPTRRSQLLLRGLTAVYWLTAFTFTHLPPSELPKKGVNDKLAHFGVYAGLAGLLYLCLWTSKRSIWATAAIVLAAGCIYGALDEISQPLVGRTCSLYDWLADAGGVLAVVGAFTVARLISSSQSRQGFPVSVEDRHD